MKRAFAISVLALALVGVLVFSPKIKRFSSNAPSDLVVIANYGPHPSLQESIDGIKRGIAEKCESCKIFVQDVSFDSSLIPQMIDKLVSMKPRIMFVITTPMAQYAKNKVRDIPLIYVAVTDPVGAGLLKHHDKSDSNMTGVSDAQDLHATLTFIKDMLPNAKKVGMLYATSESNDVYLHAQMEAMTEKLGLHLISVPIDSTRDVAMRVNKLSGVDCIYVGASGPVQPSLPVIAAYADKMNIPLINLHDDAVRNGLALASIGVSYLNMGVRAGKMGGDILTSSSSLPNPIYPGMDDNFVLVNKKQATKFNVTLPDGVSVVD